MASIPAHIPEELDRLRSQAALRRMELSDPKLLDFTSNDYLGLRRQAASPELREGAGGSRLLSGHHAAHESLESFAAGIFHAETALSFSSGYLANLAVVSTLATRHDHWLYDSRIHASLKDGLRLSPARRHAFRHQNLADLERLLKATSGNRFVLTEGLFSMDGDLPDLEKLVGLVSRYGAFLVLDEAHSTGLYGPGGAGWAVASGVEAYCLVRVHTFGKAVGWHGAVACAPKAVRDYLVNRARPFIYSTALPPSDCLHLEEQLVRMRDADAERARLLELRYFFQEKARQAGWSVPFHPSPIVPVMCPGNREVRALAAAVRAAGFDLRPIVAPTVPEGEERLRLVLHSDHREEDLAALVQVMRDSWPGQRELPG